MRILAIETSCDETAVALLEHHDDGRYSILGDRLHSQVDVHRCYEGVFPTVAKREHQKSLPLLTEDLLKELNLLRSDNTVQVGEDLRDLCERESEMLDQIKVLFENKRLQSVDAIAVTQGPGLAPALWIGVNFARALSVLWNIPLIPVNHMEGHIVAALITDTHIINPKYPLLSLLVSGGHTELVLAYEPFVYEKIGSTLDDAAGEAFDKTARMLSLPYPGGPEIGAQAKWARENDIKLETSFPRPMLSKDSFDFSYSGLKTAVRIYIEKQPELNKEKIAAIAREVEDAIVETLTVKTQKAIEQHQPKSFVLGGGVSASVRLRAEIKAMTDKYTYLDTYLPKRSLATDNAVMIGLAALRHKGPKIEAKDLRADSGISF